MTDTRRRALVAALVGVVGASVGIAGAGHAYLREWRRAIAWFAFVLGASLVLMSVFANPEALAQSPGDIPSVGELPIEVTGPILVLLVLSTLDAYRLALAGPDSSGNLGTEGPTCPHCGKEVDPSLGFCQWCTEEFESPPGPNGSDTVPSGDDRAGGTQGR